MLKIGLTGNIGSGKSTIAEIFKVLGVAVYHADDEVKKFLSNSEVIAKLINKFGETIFTNGIINKRKLADIVFTDSVSLQFLNNLIHPLLKTDFDNWITTLSLDYKYVVQEAAILFESGFEKYVDKTILVTAPENLRMQRVCERDGISSDMFLQRAANQWGENRKLKLADFVIVNDDTQLVIPKVLELHQQFILKENRFAKNNT